MGLKSKTDQFWNQRPVVEPDNAKVNISDTVQRDMELQFVFENVSLHDRVVEIGCGNGYVSEKLRSRVAHLDAFDYAEKMIDRARDLWGELNNRFFHDSVLSPQKIRPPYDVALCVRVLINLRDLDEQRLAIKNMAGMLRQGGRLILIEGYRDGFDTINAFRQSIGMEPATPAQINFYSYLGELMPTIAEYFAIERTWHSGLFDFLTRIVYPQIAGAENATGPGEFHHKIEPIVRESSSRDLARFARLHGFALSKR
ncbi:MAG: class I SAM-dependent methyltransferase [Acidobacteriaceae bacterium]|nr:class I SAM-dependent methyltransferase [Acidobacteriaceae bacterium]